MSVNPSQLRWYGSASMPDADGATMGGAVSFSTKVLFNDVSPTGTMDYVSSSASDTAATLQVYGRDSTGVIQNETKTLTGTTPVAGAQSFERLLKGLAAGTAAVGDIAAISHTPVISGHTAQGAGNSAAAVAAFITLQAADGATAQVGQIIRVTNNTPAGVQFQLRQIIALSGDIAYVDRDWATVPGAATTYNIHEGFYFELAPNQITQVRRCFYNAASDVPGGSTRNYYEKLFCVNNNTGTAFTGAAVTKLTDPAVGTLEFALTTALNDTGSVANRQTAPATGIGAFTTGAAPQSLSVPGSGNLPSGAAPNAAGAQGVWWRLTLPAGAAAQKSFFTPQLTGQTT